MSKDRAAYLKQYRKDNLVHLTQYRKQWGQDHKKQMAEHRQKWEQENPEQAKKMHLASTRESNLRLKLEVLAHYGPDGKLQCCWPDCSVNDVDMLSLDHVNNDGAEDRRSKKRGPGGINTYWRVRHDGYPAEFQTLCHNHQWKKELMRRRESWI